MSWLSDISRSFTGGSIGENTGAFLGGLVTGGNVAGVETGRRLGGGITEMIDRDGSEGQATARSVNQNLPKESGASGNMIDINLQNGGQGAYDQAFITNLLTGFGRSALQQGSRFIANRGTGTGIGLGLLGSGASMLMDGNGCMRRMVITRKMQREVKELFMYAGGDMEAVAQIYSQYKGRNYTAQDILAIMLKKFRNDGPYVTKAAVRKTRSTIRKMSRLNQLYADITPKARAAPRRRAASTTRITQVK